MGQYLPNQGAPFIATSIEVDDGTQMQVVTSGMALPVYDYVAITYPIATQEVYTFKTGGVAGITVATITVNYADSSKANISSVERT